MFLYGFPYYDFYAPGSVYAPDRSRAKVLSSMARIEFVAHAPQVSAWCLAVHRPVISQRGFPGLLTWVTWPDLSIFCTGVEPCLSYIRSAFELLTNVLFTC